MGEHPQGALRAGRHRDRGRRGEDGPARSGRAGPHAHARLQGGPVRGLQVLRPRRRRHRARPLLDLRPAGLREGRGLHPPVPGARLRGRDDRAAQLRRGDDPLRPADPGRSTPRWSRTSSSPATCDSLVLRLVEPTELAFFPGQYVDLTVPGTETTRSFSIANTLLEGERAARVRHPGLPRRPVLPAAGRRAGRRRPARRGRARSGRSRCARAATCDLVFVGGGAGMAPILSILRTLAEQGSTRKATYYYGARRRRDLCFEKELAELEAHLPDFRSCRPCPSRTRRPGTGEVGLITDVLRRHETDLTDVDSYVCGPPPMVEAAMDDAQRPRRLREAHLLRQVHHDRTVLIRPRQRGGSAMTTTPERSLPHPHFTDAEAGAKVFPDSTARTFNYFTPKKRRQSHYEDVTVEVQPDPRHYLSQGWLYGFSDGRGWLPAGVDRPQGVGLRPAGARALPRLGRQGLPVAGARLARVPRPQRGVGAHALPLQRQRGPPDQPEHRDRPSDQGVRAVEPPTGSRSWSATSARGCTSSRASGSTCSPTPTVARRRTCTTTPSR